MFGGSRNTRFVGNARSVISFFFCLLNRAIFGYEGARIVLSATGTDYEEFQNHFAGEFRFLPSL